MMKNVSIKPVVNEPKREITSVEIPGSKANPIYIKEIKDQEMPWDSIIPTAIAILTTAIVIYDRIKKAKISGKILSLAYSPKGVYSYAELNKKDIEIRGQQYFIKLSLQTIGKNFFYSDILVGVKYQNDPTRYKAKIFWADPITWNFPDGKTFELSIPKNDFLWFNNMLPVDKVSFQYLSFIVEVEKQEILELIEIDFVTPSGKLKRLNTLKISESDPMKMLFDRDIWKQKTYRN